MNSCFNILLICVLLNTLIAYLQAIRLDIYSQNRVGIFTPFKANALTICCSMFIPGRAGELAKPMYISKLLNLTFPECLSLTIVERVYDILGFVFLIAFMILLRGTEYVKTNKISFSLLIFLSMSLFIILRNENFIKKMIQKISYDSLRLWLLDTFNSFMDSLQRGWKPYPCFLTIIIWSLSCCVYWVMLNFYVKAELELSSVILVFIFSTLGLLVTITPGGLGTFEGGMYALLNFYGFKSKDCISLILGFRIVSLFPSMLLLPNILLDIRKLKFELRFLKNAKL
jgi:uncharacterized protein (TIRG00374 family)